MSIKERIQYKTLIFIFKLIKNQITGDLVNKIHRVKDKTIRETRQAQHLVINFSKTEQAKNILFDKGIELYNKLSLEIKTVNKLKNLKENIIQRTGNENGHPIVIGGDLNISSAHWYGAVSEGKVQIPRQRTGLGMRFYPGSSVRDATGCDFGCLPN